MTEIRQSGLRRETLLTVLADAKINGLFRETLRSAATSAIQIKITGLYRETLIGTVAPSSGGGRRMSLM